WAIVSCRDSGCSYGPLYKNAVKFPSTCNGATGVTSDLSSSVKSTAAPCSKLNRSQFMPIPSCSIIQIHTSLRPLCRESFTAKCDDNSLVPSSELKSAVLPSLFAALCEFSTAALLGSTVVSTKFKSEGSPRCSSSATSTCSLLHIMMSLPLYVPLSSYTPSSLAYTDVHASTACPLEAPKIRSAAVCCSSSFCHVMRGCHINCLSLASISQ